MKTKLPAWVIAASVVVVLAIIALLGWKTMSPNDPAADGHGHKIFTPEEIAKFRSESANQSASR